MTFRRSTDFALQARITFLSFPEQFPGSHTAKLERNYRSSGPILAVANAISEQDRAGFPKKLWTDSDGGTPPELVFPRDEAQQARDVCERVLAAREEEMELREQAVLYRTNHDSALLEVELTRRGIPFVKYGGCVTWRRLTSRTSSRCCDWLTIRPTS